MEPVPVRKIQFYLDTFALQNRSLPLFHFVRQTEVDDSTTHFVSLMTLQKCNLGRSQIHYTYIYVNTYILVEIKYIGWHKL